MRRIAEHAHTMRQKLQNVDLDFIHRGAAGIQFGMDRSKDARGYDIVIVMLGGNDIANGASSYNVSRRLVDLADELLERGVQHMVITTIWPRASKSFNRTAREVSEYLLRIYRDHHDITCWAQDRRLPMTVVDGTHL